MITKRLERKLVCELTECELQLRSASLADTVTTIDQTKAARKQAAKEFGDLLAGLEDRQRELSRAIRTGSEERLVACVVNFHTPAEGVKTIIRLDTGELVSEEQMSAEECQTKIFAEPDPAPVSTVHEQLVDSHAALDQAEAAAADLEPEREEQDPSYTGDGFTHQADEDRAQEEHDPACALPYPAIEHPLRGAFNDPTVRDV